MDLKAHLTRQMVFSRATFGPGARTEGVLDHMAKEIEETRKANGESSEWVDLVILALDGLTRQLWAASDYKKPAHEIAETACNIILGKQSRNELRTWPDWRTAPPNKAIEHDRTKEREMNLTKEQIESRIHYFKKNGSVAIGSEEAITIFHLALHGLSAKPRPIEEAPKDGTLQVVYCAPGNTLPGFWTICAWHEDAGWCADELREITHFIPLSALEEPKT